MLTLAVKRLTPTARLPVKGSLEAACMDLYVDSVEQDSYGWTVHTGIAVAFPPDHAMLIYPRSGLATKLGLTLRNVVGIIDSDYRGEILLKFSPGIIEAFNEVEAAMTTGTRIAQAMLVPIPQFFLKEVSELPESVRGAGGFGSTGI